MYAILVAYQVLGMPINGTQAADGRYVNLIACERAKPAVVRAVHEVAARAAASAGLQVAITSARCVKQ